MSSRVRRTGRRLGLAVGLNEGIRRALKKFVDPRTKPLAVLLHSEGGHIEIKKLLFFVSLFFFFLSKTDNLS